MSTQTVSSAALVKERISKRQVAPPFKGFPRFTFTFFKTMITNGFTLGFSLGMPIFCYLIYGVNQSYSNTNVGRGNGSALVLATMALLGALLSAASCGTHVSLDRLSGVLRLYDMTPLSPRIQLLARIAGALLVNVMFVIVCWIAGMATGARMTIDAWIISALLIIILATFLSAGIGLAGGFLLRSDGAFAANAIIVLAASWLSGMMMPLDTMSKFFQDLAPWTPVYGLKRLVEAALTDWANLRWSDIASVLIWTALFLLIASCAQRLRTSR